MNKNLSILYIFALIGVFFTGIGVHEGYHALVSDEVVSACLDFGNNLNMAHVEVIDKDNDKYEETKAFSLQLAISIILTIIITSVYKEVSK